jgi:hypothetical protein
LFNRDSQAIPENWREPILAGMSEEERVSVARHALLFESQLTSAAFPPQADNEDNDRPRISRMARIRKYLSVSSAAASLNSVALQNQGPRMAWQLHG